MGASSRALSIRREPRIEGAPRISVPKAACPRAVDRNRLRRRLRAILREAEPYRGQITVIVRKEAPKLSFAKLKAEVAGALHEQARHNFSHG
jgi:ribonuclease P protein component